MLAERLQQTGSAVELAAMLRSCSPGRQQPLWSRLHCMRTPLLAIAGSLDAKFVKAGTAMAAAAAASSTSNGTLTDDKLEECFSPTAQVWCP